MKKFSEQFLKLDNLIIIDLVKNYVKNNYKAATRVLSEYIDKDNLKFYSNGAYGFFSDDSHYKEITFIDLISPDYKTFSEAFEHMKAGGRCKYEGDPDEYYITYDYYEHGEIVAETEYGDVQDIYMTLERFDQKWTFVE